MGRSSCYDAAAGEIMCPAAERESSRATRRGGKKQQANKQPQRGLGVAQLEKIRLHNQMMAVAAYRSGVHHQQQQVPFLPAPSSELTMMAGSSSPLSQRSSYHHHAATDRGIVGVQYCGNLQTYSSSPPPTLFAHDVREGQRLGQQQRYWVATSDDSSSAEELDLELRL